MGSGPVLLKKSFIFVIFRGGGGGGGVRTPCPPLDPPMECSSGGISQHL